MTDPSQARTIPQLVERAAERFGGSAAIEEGELVLSFEALADVGLEAARACIASGVEPVVTAHVNPLAALT